MVDSGPMPPTMPLTGRVELAPALTAPPGASAPPPTPLARPSRTRAALVTRGRETIAWSSGCWPTIAIARVSVSFLLLQSGLVRTRYCAGQAAGTNASERLGGPDDSEMDSPGIIA